MKSHVSVDTQLALMPISHPTVILTSLIPWRRFIFRRKWVGYKRVNLILNARQVLYRAYQKSSPRLLIFGIFNHPLQTILGPSSACAHVGFLQSRSGFLKLGHNFVWSDKLKTRVVILDLRGLKFYKILQTAHYSWSRWGTLKNMLFGLLQTAILW